jgi:hypothetical protein
MVLDGGMDPPFSLERIVIIFCKAFFPFTLSSPNPLSHYTVTGDRVDNSPWMDCWRVVAHDCRVLIPDAESWNSRGLFDLVTSEGQRR